MIRRIALVLAGLAWGGISFLVGLYATFPEDAAKARLEYEVDKASNHEYAMTVGGVAPWRFSGLDLDEVQLYTVKKGRKTKDNPKPPMERTELVALDRLGLRVAPIQTLMGKRAVAFLAEVNDGAIEGTWSAGDTSFEVAFEAGDVDLSKLPLTTSERTINLVGKVEGDADLVLDTSDVKESSGHLKLTFPGLGLAAGSAIGGFQLPEVAFDKAVLSFEVKDGKLEVQEGTFESSTLTAQVTGDISLNKKLARSRYRLDLTFTLPEDLDELAQISPDMKRARDTEGSYHYLVTGTLFAPNFRPSRAGSRVVKDKDKDGPDRDVPFAAGERDFDPEASDDERRKAREERIRERRERLKKRREERAAQRDAERGGDKPGRDADRDVMEDGPEPGFPEDEDLPPGLDDGPEFPPPPEDDGPPPEFEGPPE